MNAFQEASATGLDLDVLVLDRRTESLLERRRSAANRHPARRRGWFVRRALLAADATGLILAFLLAKLIVSGESGAQPWVQFAAMVLALPLWVVAAKLNGLYDRDEEHVDHSTIDEVVGVFQLVTLGAWAFFVASWLAGRASPHVPRLILFWLLAIVFVTSARGFARTIARRSPLYLQNTIIVGAGDIGQLAARKLLQHPEYGINLVGFVDAHPRPRRPELEHLALVGPADRLTEIISVLDIERVIIAFSDADHEEQLRTIRELRKLDVQIDVVPRLFEVVGPKAGIHTFEGLAVVGLPPSRLSPSSRLLKRSLDCIIASAMIFLLAPVMVTIAILIRLDSSGPVLFRQRRLGRDMRPFTVLKFRTMRVDTDQEEHRRYIATTLTHDASPNANGLYKLDRSSSVTSVGRFLRKTSLDELPQLFNVLGGDMSLVGPRPCLDYETEGFAEHHFERFLMPPGLTGLWQVTARARSTFGEALDMDVEYVRGWSFSLDLRLLLKTPFSLVRMRATT
jgi:exopolysaccharide biosynthesis polyprenyl glycosylphosphotransferase